MSRAVLVFFVTVGSLNFVFVRSDDPTVCYLVITPINFVFVRSDDPTVHC